MLRLMRSIGKFLVFSTNLSRDSKITFGVSSLVYPLSFLMINSFWRRVGFKLCICFGNTEWAAAVAELAVKVYSEQGEYAKVLADAILRLGQPCRDGGAEASQWLHCLAVTSLLLERIKSLRQLAGCAIGSQEIVDALLVPAVSGVYQLPLDLRVLGFVFESARK